MRINLDTEPFEVREFLQNTQVLPPSFFDYDFEFERANRLGLFGQLETKIVSAEVEMPQLSPRVGVSQQVPKSLLLIVAETSDIDLESLQRRHQVNGLENDAWEPILVIDVGRITRCMTPAFDRVVGFHNGPWIGRDCRLPAGIRIKRDSGSTVILT